FFQRQRPRQRHHARLRRRISGDLCLPEGPLSPHCTKIDDASPASPTHVRKSRAANVQNSHEVRCKHALPIFQSRLAERAPAKISDVIDYDVEPAETVCHRSHKLLRQSCITYVRLDGNTIDAAGLQLAQRLLCRGLVRTVRDSHARAVLSKSQGYALANATATARYQGNAIPKRHSSFPKNRSERKKSV